jgi:hypothetical protein
MESKKINFRFMVIALGFTCKGRKKKEAEKRLIHMLFMWTRKCFGSRCTSKLASYRNNLRVKSNQAETALADPKEDSKG